MYTAIALQEPLESREPKMSKLLAEAEWQEPLAQDPPKRPGRFTVQKAAKWASIAGLLVLGGLWSRATPFEVEARFIVAAGAIIVMAQALLARRYAAVAVSASLVRSEEH